MGAAPDQPLDTDLGILKTVEQLAAFNSVARALMSTLDLDELVQIVGQTVAGLLGPRSWALSLWDPKDAVLRVALAMGTGAEQLHNAIVPLGQGLSGAAFESRQAVRVEAVTQDPAVQRRFGPAPPGSCSLIAAPLVVRGRSHGIIELLTEPGAPPFEQHDLEQVLGIAEFVAVAIENARNLERVHELTITDEVTGLYNSRHLRALVEKEVERARRFSHPLSLVFLDLDHFKQVNDSSGHLAGTALLREVGQLIRATMRQMNPAFRYGGDEFALLLLETDLTGACLFAERLRDAFRAQRFLTDRGLSTRLTASLGVATYPLHAQTGVGLIEAADRAMYLVKAAGKDGVRAATPP